MLDDETRRVERVERVAPEARLVDGLPLDVLDDGGRSTVEGLVDRGWVNSERVALTLLGRLFADAVGRDLLP